MIEILGQIVIVTYLIAVIAMLAALPISLFMMIYSVWKGDKE